MMTYLAMDGFAAFIWPAYGLSALALGGLTAWVLLEARSARRLAARSGERAGQ